MSAQKLYQANAQPKGLPIIQDQDPGTIVVMQPCVCLNTFEMDRLYDLPFTRRCYPRYDKLGGVPALEPIRFSITTDRGCFGGCQFCSIHLHQGKQISSRSIDSLLSEAGSFGKHEQFRGTISDVGGPTANIYGMECDRSYNCRRLSCLAPSVCKHFNPKDVGHFLDMT